jgi:threonine aldolase
MEEVREGKLGDVPVKELGMRMFASRLKENKFEMKVDGARLFEVLSGDKSKEKVIKEAQELLDEPDGK